MKKPVLALVALALLSANSFVSAQQPAAQTDVRKPLPAQVTTPEMWFYEQELRRRNDPAELVREKAQFQAEQRQRRIAAMKWYGYSNQRPMANPTPFGSSYSPGWVANSARPFGWVGTVRPTIVVPHVDTYRR